MILDIMAIPLSQGLYALVDGKDYERLNRYKWYAYKAKNTYYAGRNEYKKVVPNRKQIIIPMHRDILGLKTGDGKYTDHINHCGLDNREYNIRICTNQQNCQNQKISNHTSKYKGVSWHKQKWQAQICYSRKCIYLGLFNNEIEAAKIYDKKAKELFGEFANCNFITKKHTKKC